MIGTIRNWLASLEKANQELNNEGYVVAFGGGAVFIIPLRTEEPPPRKKRHYRLWWTSPAAFAVSPT